jgi:hypothetical protein
MTATNAYRDTEYAGPTPTRGTYPAAANKLYPKGTIVQRDASGRATPGAAANGFPAVGVSNATYNNLTGAPDGAGANDAIDVEVLSGVFGFDYSGTPLPGETVWVLDNQTVTDTASTNGVAGVCAEVRNGQCYVWMGPGIAALFSDDSAAETVALAAEAELAARVPTMFFNIGAARIYSTGAVAIPFNDGVADGIDPTAEGFGFRFNVASTAAIVLAHPLPPDMDAAEDVIVHVTGYRVGAADPTAAVTVGAFFRIAGAAFNADATAGGATTAFDGATNAITDETVTLAAANVEPGPGDLLLTLVPTAALDADDLVITAVWATYTKLAA